jgi:hypothetical protein
LCPTATKRITAPEQLREDTVEATVYGPMGEAEALSWSARCALAGKSVHSSSAWLSSDISEYYGYSLEELGTRFDAILSSVSGSRAADAAST